MKIPWRLRSSTGFTLVEAMVVASIVVIMVGFGYSGFSGLQQREKATAAATQLMGHIKEAKMLAMEKHVSHALNITGNVYTIYKDDNNSCTREVNEPIVHQVDVSQDFAGVTFGGNVSVRFDTKGMPRNSGGGLGSASANLTQPGRRTCTVAISNVGRIDVTACTDF